MREKTMLANIPDNISEYHILKAYSQLYSRGIKFVLESKMISDQA